MAHQPRVHVAAPGHAPRRRTQQRPVANDHSRLSAGSRFSMANVSACRYPLLDDCGDDWLLCQEPALHLRRWVDSPGWQHGRRPVTGPLLRELALPTLKRQAWGPTRRSERVGRMCNRRGDGRVAAEGQGGADRRCVAAGAPRCFRERRPPPRDTGITLGVLRCDPFRPHGPTARHPPGKDPVMNHLARRRRCAVDVFAVAACRSGAAARLHQICHIDLPDNGNRAIVLGCGHGGGGLCQVQSVPSNWCRKSRRPSSTAGRRRGTHAAHPPAGRPPRPATSERPARGTPPRRRRCAEP